MTEPITDESAPSRNELPSASVGESQLAMLSPALVTPAVAIGGRFPDGLLIDASGQQTSIASVRAGRSAVVVFYRGEWCPYCNLALRVYRENLVEPLRRRGITLIAISPQTPDESLSMIEKQDLDFPVVSDPGNGLARALGILTRPSEAIRAAQLERGLDITEVNADGTIDLPMATTAIIDRDGRMVWIDIHPDPSTRTTPQQVLDALDELEL